MSDQAQSLRELVSNSSKGARVLTITSGKGGVGKTSLAVNLAISLARLGLRVGILDADLGLANVDIVLGLSPRYNLMHVVNGQKRLNEIVLPGPEGILVYAGGAGVFELANLSQWRLERFVREIATLDATLDYLIVDTGAGISRNVMSFVLACDEVILVTTPELTAITDAYGVIKLIAAQQVETKIRVVVNMARSEAEAEKVLRSLNLVVNQFVPGRLALEMLGYIPADAAVTMAIREQEPLILSHPGSKAATQIESIARRLVHDGVVQPPPKGVGALFQRMARLVRRRGSRI